MRIFAEDTAALIIDFQEKLVPAIANNEEIVAKAATFVAGLKELGVPSGQDGFTLAKTTILMLCENRFCKLKNGAYLAAGALADPPMDNDQVYQAISRGIRNAWETRNERVWQCYFPEGSPGNAECPSNRDFLFAVVDFVELWQGCCEEVNYVG